VAETHTVQYDEPFVRQWDNIERSLLSLQIKYFSVAGEGEGLCAVSFHQIFLDQNEGTVYGR
jgi:hypothetical protein